LFNGTYRILANQHFIGLSELAAPLNISIKLLTGSSKTVARRNIHEELENGSLQILIGTHIPYWKISQISKFRVGCNR
jgi:RecG-like helicase